MSTRLAVDIGGTFVDAIAFDEQTGRTRMFKAPTTPDAPARGVIDAVTGLGEVMADVSAFAHGTTLGLNAILQRRGADVGIITNAGFSDLFEIARAAIPTEHMYNFSYAPPPSLVRRRHRLGVPCRLDYLGRELVALDEAAVLAAGTKLVQEFGLTSIAICFLHSYADPSHERRAAQILRTAFPEVSVAISSDISREYREYERTSTVVLDAYIRPVLHDYLGALTSRLSEAGFARPLHILRSGGGAMTAEHARTAPLMTVLSGPAGGVIGASALSRQLDWDRVLSFDVGGTSVDACVIENGTPSEVHEAAIDGFPLLIPIFDIRTVGAGGGSIAWTDDGLLRVGPRSAGAVPGPVAYGLGGTEPTLTDAALTLGFLDAKTFLDGGMTIDTDAAVRAVQDQIAEPLGLDTTRAAASIFTVLLARTVGALREITVERGLDPREFTLLAYGGAGPLLGPMVAREMGIKTCAIPRVPAGFSAFGMLMADLQHERSATVLRALEDAELSALARTIAELRADGDAALAGQGVPSTDREFRVILDVRYRGQEHSLAIELNASDDAATVLERFHAEHRSRHGHSMPEPAQIVTVRVRAVGVLTKPTIAPIEVSNAEFANAELATAEVAHLSATRPAFDIATATTTDFQVYRRDELGSGTRIKGPAIVEEGTCTTVLFGDQKLDVDPYGQLLITSSVGVAS